MKKQIGILTYYYKNRNFGGILQAYALQKTIEQMGYDCEQISYQLTPSSWKKKLQTGMQYRSIGQNLKMVAQILVGKVMGIFLNGRMVAMTKERNAGFDAFEKGIPHSDTVYTYDSLPTCLPDYRAFIVGSDQIWTGGVDLPRFCLDFVPPEVHKIAYAASSSGTFYGDWQKAVLQTNLPGFYGLSTREKSLGEVLSQLSGCRVDTVLDPTFLLEPAEWAKIADENVRPKAPYILCYLLGGNKKHRTIAQKIARQKKVDLWTFPYIVGNAFRLADWKFGDVRDFTSGPREFVGLVKNADAIITDSFHAMVFSVIFHKKFCVLPRYKKASGNANTRVSDFLQEIGGETLLVEDADAAAQAIDYMLPYEKVDAILQAKRSDSLAWIRQKLSAL